MHVKRHQFVLFPELHRRCEFNVNIGRYDVIDKSMKALNHKEILGKLLIKHVCFGI